MERNVDELRDDIALMVSSVPVLPVPVVPEAEPAKWRRDEIMEP